MSIFGKIKDAIFGKKAVAAQPAARKQKGPVPCRTGPRLTPRTGPRVRRASNIR